MTDSVPFAHVSDTHLCYEAYQTLSPSGNNQRGEDVVRALAAAVKQIRATDPPLVIHTGDAFERSNVPIAYLVTMQRLLGQLAEIRPDGTRRQVVIFDGNHDHPVQRRQSSPLDLFRSMVGVHVTTSEYAAFDFDPAELNCDERLAGIVVHAVPHDVLKRADELATVTPTPGKLNVLATHGVAEGHDLFYRALGREYPIPAELMKRGFDYVALGHFHQQGPVELGKFGTQDLSKPSRIWYAGSTENISARDMKGNEVTERGWLHVTVHEHDMPDVAPQLHPVRRMVRLPDIVATDLSASDLADRLKSLVDEQERLTGAIVIQPVSGISREQWGLVDVRGVRDSAALTLRYDFSVKYARRRTLTPGANIGVGDLDAQLLELAGEHVADPDRDDVLTIARKHLDDAVSSRTTVARTADEGDQTDEGQVDAPADGNRADDAGGTAQDTLPAEGDGDAADTSTSDDGQANDDADTADAA